MLTKFQSELGKPEAVRRNDLILSVRLPGHPPSWNRVVATDETTVTFVNGARILKTKLGPYVTMFRPRVIVGGT